MSKRNNLTLDLKPAVPAVTAAGGGPGGGNNFPPVSGIAPSKKARLRTAPEILTSPDVQMLKLTSPQLAEFLTRNPTLATPTPSGGYTFPTTVTAEQELYVRGFEEALKNNRSGHIARDCPDGRRDDRRGGSGGGFGRDRGGRGGGGRACYNCNREGHMARDCPDGDRRDRGGR